MLRWYEFCINFGDLNALTTPLPIQKPEQEDILTSSNAPSKKSEDKSNLVRGKSADILPLVNTTNRLSPGASSQPQPQLKVTRRKDSKTVTKITNENQPLYYTHKGSRIPSLTKSRSFLHSGTRV